MSALSEALAMRVQTLAVRAIEVNLRPLIWLGLSPVWCRRAANVLLFTAVLALLLLPLSPEPLRLLRALALPLPWQLVRVLNLVLACLA